MERQSFCHRDQWNFVICNKVDETGEYYVSRNNPDMERQVLGSHPFMETKKESQPEVEQW